MSAQIPSTMLLSDLLKSTGYDCPEDQAAWNACFRIAVSGTGSSLKLEKQAGSVGSPTYTRNSDTSFSLSYGGSTTRSYTRVPGDDVVLW